MALQRRSSRKVEATLDLAGPPREHDNGSDVHFYGARGGGGKVGKRGLKAHTSQVLCVEREGDGRHFAAVAKS